MQRASHSDQLAARDFIQSIMEQGTDDVTSVEIVRERAASMSTAALELVGRVLGVGDAVECSAVMVKLNTHTLCGLQAQLGCMGCMGMEHHPGR
jgi:hypothetical protein